MDFLRKLLFMGSPAPVRIPTCPDCKVELKLTFAGDVAVNQCHQCKGLFVDGDSFEKVLSQKSPDLKEVEGEIRYEKTYRPSMDRACPACQAPMRNYSFRNDVYLDSCPQGHGIWLDSGELEMVHRIRQSASQMTQGERQAMSSAMMASSKKMTEISSDVRKFQENLNRQRIDSDSCGDSYGYSYGD